MAPAKEEVVQSVEPSFLSQADAQQVKLRIGQMNKTEHEGLIKDIGRYEINVDVSGRLITVLKQEISFLSAPHPLLTVPAPPAEEVPPQPAAQGRPNIQQEFLERAIREKHMLTIFLVNGQRVRAVVEAFDNFTLLLREGDRQHLYYKHAITTINR
jgi:host factor-I protein